MGECRGMDISKLSCVSLEVSRSNALCNSTSAVFLFDVFLRII